MWRVGALLAWAALAVPACAGAAAFPPAGHWRGVYQCAQGNTALDLTIVPVSPTALTALFYFHAIAANQGVPSGCFLMRGTYDAASASVDLTPTVWLAQPAGYVSVGLAGVVGQGGAVLSGAVFGPACSHFSLAVTNQPEMPPAPSVCRIAGKGPTV
ncbi:MAG TPA: hypothetical protein PLC74_07290 [Acetobacteraceae bacterium]|nr:hypothetical protein [Acetobacteraceae bacterium]